MDDQHSAQTYGRSKRRLSVAQLLLTICLLVAIQWSGGFRWWLDHVAQYSMNPWWLVAGAVIGLAVLHELVQLPLEWRRGYALEHQYQLSTESAGHWWWNRVKGWGVGGVLMLLAAEGFYFCLRTAGDWWWLWATGGWMICSIGLTRIAPTWLLPMFYPCEPLDDSECAGRLQQMCERVGVRVLGVYRLGLSQKTRKANAALVGVGGSRRVLLGDTLLEQFPQDEVEVVLAHELAHHVERHVWWGMGVSSLATLLACWMLHVVSPYLVTVGGARILADPVLLPLLGALSIILSVIMTPINNGMSRVLEASADRFALRVTNRPSSFRRCMNRLAEQNLAEMSPPRWVVWWWYDHPPIAERLLLAGEGTGE